MTLNLVIAILIAFSVWRGYRRGAVEIIGSFVVLIISLIIASAIGTSVGKGLLGGSFFHPIAGFFLVLICLMVLGSFILRKIKPKRGVIGFADKIIGALLSGVRMLLIIGLIAAIFRLLQVPSPETANGSAFYKASLNSVSLLVRQIKPIAVSATDDILNKNSSDPNP